MMIDIEKFDRLSRTLCPAHVGIFFRIAAYVEGGGRLPRAGGFAKVARVCGTTARAVWVALAELEACGLVEEGGDFVAPSPAILAGRRGPVQVGNVSDSGEIKACDAKKNGLLSNFSLYFNGNFIARDFDCGLPQILHISGNFIAQPGLGMQKSVAYFQNNPMISMGVNFSHVFASEDPPNTSSPFLPPLVPPLLFPHTPLTSPPYIPPIIPPSSTLSGARERISKPSRAKPQTAAPESFEPNEAGLRVAAENGMAPSEIVGQVEKFLDSSRASGRRYSDWQAAWRTWCRNYRQFRADRGRITGGNWFADEAERLRDEREGNYTG